MFASLSTIAISRAFLLTASLVLVAGLIVVPWLVTFSNFAFIAAVAVGISWVSVAIYRNGQPVPSLAQSIHDSEAAVDAGKR